MSDQVVQHIPIWTYWLPPASLLAGVFITSIINYINKKSEKTLEEKKHLKELLLKTSIEFWKQDIERIKLANKKAPLFPLESYVFHLFKLSDEISANKSITPERIVEIRDEVKKLAYLLMENDKKLNNITIS